MKKSGISLKKIKFFKVCIKMDKEIIKFGDTEVEKHRFYQHKTSISINNIDIIKIVISNKGFFCKTGFKYFIGYRVSTKK